jgi:LemA protein
MQLFYILIGVVLVWLLVVYNQFISMRNKAKNAYANIDVMLKKRFDLIPQLVQAVKGYMNYEQEVLEKIVELRNHLERHNLSEDEKVSIQNILTENMGRVFVVVENYPNLKASRQFVHLQKSLAEIEEQLSASRRSYNMSVTHFNTLLQKFPSNVVGKLFGFKKKELFLATVSEKVVQDVSKLLQN